PISVNINQLQRLDLGEKLKLETTQIQGNFANRDPAGGQVVIRGNNWRNYLPQIERVTAGILINVKNQKRLHRRIAAKNPKNPNDFTPELTLGQALEKAFGAIYDGTSKSWYFIDEETDIKHTLNPHLMYFVYDNKTRKIIKVESNNVDKIYDIKIRPGMNIEINIPEISEGFQEETGLFTGGEINKTNGLNNDRCYTILPGTKIETKEINIRNEYVYLVMFDIKGEGTGETSVYVSDTNKEEKLIKKINYTNKYKREIIKLNTFDKEKDATKIVIKSNDEKSVYIDNFSIINLGHQYDILKQENRSLYSIIKDNVYKVYLKNLLQLMTLLDKNLLVLSYDEKRFQNFKFIYEESKGAFYIKPEVYPLENVVLTWEAGSQNLTFIKQREKINTRQLWYIKHVKKMEIWDGYRIISCYDRSKCLDYSFANPKDGKDIKIETIDYSSKSQLFVAKKNNNL
ncbi:peptidase, partial [Bacillus cereus]